MDFPLVVALAGLALLVVLLQIVIGVLFLRQQRAVARISARLGQLISGVSLLTDTAESGFRDVAAEMNRVNAAQTEPPRAPVPAERRITTAVRRGHSVRQIAAAERMSEGEVNLRAQLAARHLRRTADDGASA